MGWRIFSKIRKASSGASSAEPPTAFALAKNLIEAGDLDAAVPLLRTCLAQDREQHGNRAFVTLRTLSTLGDAVYNQGQLEAALPLYSELHQSLHALFGADNSESLAASHNLGRVHLALNQLTEARPLLERAAAGGRKAFGVDHPITLRFQSSIEKLDRAGPTIRTSKNSRVQIPLLNMKPVQKVQAQQREQIQKQLDKRQVALNQKQLALNQKPAPAPGSHAPAHAKGACASPPSTSQEEWSLSSLVSSFWQKEAKV